MSEIQETPVESDRTNIPPPPATHLSHFNVATRSIDTDGDQHKLRGWWSVRRLRWFGLGAVVVPLILLLLSSVQLQQQRDLFTAQLNTLQQDLELLRVENEQLTTTNQRLQQRLHLRERQLTLFADATRVVTLEGTEEAPQASGSFHVGQLSSVLVLRKLPPLPADQTYQLWLIPEQGDPMSADLVQVDETGMSTMLIPMAIQPKDFAAVGLSIEPARGSQQPTGPIVLLGTINY
jgi:hypothetical protein